MRLGLSVEPPSGNRLHIPFGGIRYLVGERLRSVFVGTCSGISGLLPPFPKSSFPKMAGVRRRAHFLAFICLELCHISAVWGHSCSHAVPKPHEVIHDVHLEPVHVMRKRSIDQRLRIHLVYDGSVSRLPLDKQELVKNDLIPNAVSYWEDTLQVRQTAGPIRLLRQCKTDRVRYQDGVEQPYCVDDCSSMTMCGETPVPAQHLEACRVAHENEEPKTLGYSGEGVDNADFILYVSAVPTLRCDIGTTVAYAAYCQLENALDRPVAGYVNLCPEGISTMVHDIHQMHSTIKHEILHALGFSAGLYAFFRDENGDPLTPRVTSTGKPEYNYTTQMYQWSDQVIHKVWRPDWKVRSGRIEKEINVVVTPKVVAEVRRHFNCSSLEGAELEDQGVLGTALTHWEKRVFENEAMTGTYTQNPLVSRITLALMEDTGWYRVNYENAQPLTWGKNLGCDFVKKSCLDWMILKKSRNEHIHPYCNRVKKGGLQTECTDDGAAVALCNLVEFDMQLDNQYQNFYTLPGVHPDHVDRFGGSVILADYCPYIQEFDWKQDDQVIRGSRCNLPTNNAAKEINYALEKYGNHSRCFYHDMPWMLRHCKVSLNVEHWGSGCYQYDCSSDSGLSIWVHGQWYPCYKSGQIIQVKKVTDDWLHEGTVMCPSCQEVCKPQGVTCPKDMNPPESLEVQAIPPCSRATVFMGTISSTVSSLIAIVLLLF